MVKHNKKKQNQQIEEVPLKKRDTKRERLLMQMIEKKKQMQMVQQTSIELKPIKLNWKDRLMRKVSFRYMNFWFQYFVNLLNINKIIEGFKIIIYSSHLYNFQSFVEIKKDFSKKFTSYFICVSSWLLALNIRKEPNWSLSLFIKAALQFYNQFMKISFFVKWVIYKGADRSFKNKQSPICKINVKFTRNSKLGFYKKKASQSLKYLRNDFLHEYFNKFVDKWMEKKRYLNDVDYNQNIIKIFTKFAFNTYKLGDYKFSSLKSYNDDLLKYRLYKKRVLRPIDEAWKLRERYGAMDNLSSMFIENHKSFIILHTAMQIQVEPQKEDIE